MKVSLLTSQTSRKKGNKRKWQKRGKEGEGRKIITEDEREEGRTEERTKATEIGRRGGQKKGKKEGRKKRQNRKRKKIVGSGIDRKVDSEPEGDGGNKTKKENKKKG